MNANQVRLKVRTTALGLLLGASSCVPAIDYEAARSAAEAKSEAHRRAALQLEVARAEIQRLQAKLRQQSSKLEVNDTTLEQARLEQNLIAKQRDESAFLVEQLRGELARAGEHLQDYSNQKLRLERELSKTRSDEARSEEHVLLLRDLGNAIAQAKLQEDISFTSEGDSIVVRAPADAVFDANQTTFRPALTRLLGVLWNGWESRWSVLLREADHDVAAPAELADQRRQRIQGAIDAAAVRARVAFEAEDRGTPRQYELVLRPPAQ